MGNAADSGVAQSIKVGALTHTLGKYEAPVKAELEKLAGNEFTKRLWNKDASLWTNQDESQWLGWLDVVKTQLTDLPKLASLAKTVKEKAYKHAVLLGMGGSSLCVEVLRQTFGSAPGNPTMLVLDSVVPAQILTVRKQIDPSSTLFIVASKSGSTTEPNVLCQYFYDQTKKVVGDKVGDHFIAITDSGSSMEKKAQELKFGHIFHGVPSIGGRFSALSNFGMVPAAVMGLDIKTLLQHAENMLNACNGGVAPTDNPGVLLGTILGVLTRSGRDKMTIYASPTIHSFGTWLEQLLAESTGKEGKGIIPIAGETLFAPPNYADDRAIVYVRLSSKPDSHQDNKIDTLEKAGQPVVRINVPDAMHVGAEMVRWEIATATAGSILGINAFNQPNVQESKDFTKEILAEYIADGELPENKLLVFENDFELFADDENAKYLKHKTGGKETLKSVLQAHLSQIHAGDYLAINAYVECCPHLEEKLQKLRDFLMRKHKVATTLGFGPRFLHSTGQLHKGGPNSGVFLQITSAEKEDLAIPGEKYSFTVLKEAQALGDFKALSSRKRRLLRLHLPENIDAALDKIFELICEPHS